MITMFLELKKADRFSPGSHIRIDNEPFMPLVIEVLEERGPDGHLVVSVAHYGEQNRDAMRDPEMLFQVIGEGAELVIKPYYYRHDYVGVEEWSRYHDDHGRLIAKPRLEREQESFAAIWALSLDNQGFPDALCHALASKTAGL